METRPDYYDDFKCIAGECNHNCCIGWEIDIDDDTLKKYKCHKGELQKKFQSSIALKPTAHFILGENERCPFLNNNNLCELITKCGEDMLCQICSDHPRFYNDVYGITEKGIGLSCEAAAKLILEKGSPFRLIYDGDSPCEDFFEFRNRIFSILQDREKSINERIAGLLAFADVTLPLKEIDWIDVYKKLERLDDAWDKYLESADGISFDIPEQLALPCEQLLCYFIYRHLSGALEDFLFAERIQFAILSCLVIVSLNKTKTLEEMLEVSRLYSSEIEYSDQNIDVLLDILNEYNEK